MKPQEKGVCQFINQFTKDLPAWANEALENYRNVSCETIEETAKRKQAKGMPRAYLALPSQMKFRILSEVNNLKIINQETGEVSELAPHQKQKIIAQLNSQKTSSFKALLELIDYDSKTHKFNFESEKRKKLDGNETAILLSKEEFFGKKWHEFALVKQDEIVEFLLECEEDKKDEIKNRALTKWQVSEEQAQNLSQLPITKFKQGCGNLSKELLQRLCELMEAKKCRYYQAMKELELDHSNQEFGDGKAELLAYYGEAIPASTMPVKIDPKKKFEDYSEEEKHGRIANPTVHVALNQLRKVVNEIIKENGKPSEIVVELARDLKISKDEKREIENQQKKNKDENKKFAEELEKLKQRNTYENRLKLKLFRELEKANNGVACCPYSGRPINITNLFSHEVEIEHILPFAKTYDDSIANKTIAYRSENQKKGNRSPFEAFGDITFERIQNLPKNKRWRFYENAMEKFKDESGFQERQINDTRYLSKIARQYLSQICDQNKIKVANGKLTSLLRHHWGLNGILKKNQSRPNHPPLEGESKSRSDFGEGLDFVHQHQLQFSNPSPNASHSTLPQGEGDYPESEEKWESKPKKRDDHRHHAVDAIVIAMTETKLLQQISRDNARGHDLDRLIINLPSHWNRFREDAVEAIERIVVSHKSDHGKEGELHEATYYGILSQPESIEQENGKLDEGYNVVYSKPLASLTDGQISSIRNQKIREELKKKLAGIADKKEVAKILAEEVVIEGKSGKQTKLKIKNIRLLKKEESVIPITHKQLALQKKELGAVEQKIHIKGVVPGSNHHIAFWKLPKLPFLPLLKLKGTKFEKLLQSLSEKELENFERFKAKQEQLKSWIAKDGSYAAVCSSFFEINNSKDSNDFRPHPNAKLLMKIHNGDLVKLKNKGEELVARLIQLVPSNDRIVLVKHNETGNEIKQIRISFSGLKEAELRKIFVSPAGKVFDSGPILKNTEKQAE